MQGFSAQALQEVEGMEERVSQREKDIKLIAKSINDLAEIFKDLSALVIDQVWEWVEMGWEGGEGREQEREGAEGEGAEGEEMKGGVIYNDNNN